MFESQIPNPPSPQRDVCFITILSIQNSVVISMCRLRGEPKHRLFSFEEEKLKAEFFMRFHYNS